MIRFAASFVSMVAFATTPAVFAAETIQRNQPYVAVLGVAQDGGFPQAGCRKPCCRVAWRKSELQRHVSCLAIIDPQRQQRWLIDATPDFPRQLRSGSAIAHGIRTRLKWDSADACPHRTLQRINPSGPRSSGCERSFHLRDAKDEAFLGNEWALGPVGETAADKGPQDCCGTKCSVKRSNHGCSLYGAASR